jgi:Cu-Zn family superoxide dismutase
MKKLLLLLLFSSLTFVFVSCSDNGDELPLTEEGSVTVEMVQVYGDDAGQSLGSVEIFGMKDGADGLAAVINLNGFTPGSHGFHVHVVNDCSNGGNAAGGHYDNTQEGGDRGALITLAANNSGVINYYLKSISGTLKLSEIYGRSLMIHGVGDNASVRFACGTIASPYDYAALPVVSVGAVTVEMVQIYGDEANKQLGSIKLYGMQETAGLAATVKISGFSAGSHSFHVHETGDCSNGGNNTGGHYDNKVTDPNVDRGALSNLTADDNGIIDNPFKPASDTLRLSEIYSRTLVIHGTTDDSNVKFACGVIPQP